MRAEDIDSFLSELTRMFLDQRSKSCGSLSITMKQYDGRTKPKPRPSKAAAHPAEPPSEYKCLLRARLGNKKISTVIKAHQINKFQLAYSSVLKGNIDSLKKKDKKSTKQKATQ